MPEANESRNCSGRKVEEMSIFNFADIHKEFLSLEKNCCRSHKTVTPDVLTIHENKDDRNVPAPY